MISYCLVDSRCGLQQYYNNISVFYTRLTCVRIQPAPPIPRTAPPLPYEIRPAPRPSIIIHSLLRSYAKNRTPSPTAAHLLANHILEDYCTYSFPSILAPEILQASDSEHRPRRSSGVRLAYTDPSGER